MNGEHLHKLTDIDRLVHEPARLLLLCTLSLVEEADFLFLLRETGLTRGNLSAHLSKLEAADLIRIEKGYRGKRPQTICNITKAGQEALQTHRQLLKQALDL